MKSDNNKIIGLIPARGNSKGIPQKNLLNIGNKPLIYYAIRAALNSKYISQSFVSSENNEILKISQEYGIGILKRPKQLSSDDTSMESVIQNSLEQLERMKLKFNILILLQPTSPLRDSQDIDKAIRKHIESDADSVVSVTKTDHWHPIRAKKIEDNILHDYCLEEKEGVRRQDLPPAYFRNGAFYSVKRDVLINEHRLYGRTTRPYIMPSERSVDINEEIDFKLAEILLGEM